MNHSTRIKWVMYAKSVLQNSFEQIIHFEEYRYILDTRSNIYYCSIFIWSRDDKCKMNLTLMGFSSYFDTFQIVYSFVSVIQKPI
jgi:hypothetical protein